jgi:hypothetical protein
MVILVGYDRIIAVVIRFRRNYFFCFLIEENSCGRTGRVTHTAPDAPCRIDFGYLILTV